MIDPLGKKKVLYVVILINMLLMNDNDWISKYMAPEYASSGKLTEKSDVYSFEVMLLELITGHKPVDASQPLGDESLVEWVSFINLNFDIINFYLLINFI